MVEYVKYQEAENEFVKVEKCWVMISFRLSHHGQLNKL